jgi:hypothetical protein
MAKVSPLFKSGSLFDRSNFRPISVLAVISKILERHVHNYFYHFLTEYNLLVENQFGFRTSHSCELAVTHLTDKILTNIDNKKLNGLLLVDFKKAFDLVENVKLNLVAQDLSTWTQQNRMVTNTFKPRPCSSILPNNLRILQTILYQLFLMATCLHR